MSGTELPKYKCHKQVWALKIKLIERTEPFADPPGWMITPEDPRYGKFFVNYDYVHKHDPKPGGYWVQYEGDGYQSYSPADAFEGGYTLIE